MAEMTGARKGQLLRKLFEILLANPEGLSASEAMRRLQVEIELTEYELGRTSTNAVRFDVNIRFATTDCSRAGWLTKHKGVWSVTEEGKQALKKYADPEQF